MLGLRKGYDYIIVGAGPAGCVVAEQLSRDPSCTVLLLEAGGRRSSLLARLLDHYHLLPAGLRWNYRTEPQSCLAGRQLYFPQGRALGGATVINAMTYVRGHPSDYDRWAAEGNAGWHWEAVLAAFKRLERNHSLQGELHSSDGLLPVSDQVQPHRLTRQFVAAAVETGLPLNRDFNGPTQEGAGLYQVTQERGRRCSAAKAFLEPARRRNNLTILTRARVSAIRFAHDRATGVLLERSGQLHQVDATGEIILTAGAIHSPQLLLLSGIGPAEGLSNVGVRVHHELPGVGHNLHDHLNVPVLFRCANGKSYDRWDRPDRLLRYGLQYLLFNSGIATSNWCEGGAFARSTPDLCTPDLQLHFLPLLWWNAGQTSLRGSGVTLEAAFLNPRSRGRVWLASADFRAAPRIDPGYCTEPGDLEALIRAVRLCRRILQAEPFRPDLREELYPGCRRQSDDELADYVRGHAVTSYHPVGTCRMGQDDLAVVDEQLRVRGLRGLRVIDSSIMPRIISGSTQAASMMIGAIGAALLTNQRA